MRSPRKYLGRDHRERNSVSTKNVVPVFVADDCDSRDLAVGWHLFVFVRLAEKRIHSHTDAFGHARRLSHPNWGSDGQDICVENARPQLRAVVTTAFVRAYARFDIEIDDLDNFAFAVKVCE